MGLGERVRLANEMEFKDKFPECEVGAMPPFGNLWDMPVYTAESLMKDVEIAFNSGTHKEVIKMKTEDYVKLVQPQTLKFSKKLGYNSNSVIRLRLIPLTIQELYIFCKM